jgi:hypothetical protein
MTAAPLKAGYTMEFLWDVIGRCRPTFSDLTGDFLANDSAAFTLVVNG